MKSNEIFSMNIPNICLLWQFVLWSAIRDFWNLTCQSTPQYKVQTKEFLFFWLIPKNIAILKEKKVDSRIQGGEQIFKNFTSYCGQWRKNLGKTGSPYWTRNCIARPWTTLPKPLLLLLLLILLTPIPIISCHRWKNSQKWCLSNLPWEKVLNKPCSIEIIREENISEDLWIYEFAPDLWQELHHIFRRCFQLGDQFSLCGKGFAWICTWPLAITL